MGLWGWLFGTTPEVREDGKTGVRLSGNSCGDASRLRGSHKISSSCASEEVELKAQMDSDLRPPGEPRKTEDELVRAAEELQAVVSAEKARLRWEAEARENNDIRYSLQTETRYSLSVDDTRAVMAMVERQKSFGRMLAHYVNARCDGRASTCYRRAGVSRQLYSQIISDLSKKVAKRTALQLCIGLKFNRPQAEQFLKFAGYSLAPSSAEDAAFGWCLDHGVYSMFDVNSLLVRIGCDPIALN